MPAYRVKELFGPTLQGEGQHAGWSCVFLRLSGCNAWDGRAETRAASACPYCDTDFLGGEQLELSELLLRLEALRPSLAAGCVLTGGEPLLQADTELLQALGDRFAWVDIETNGTRPCPTRPGNVYLSCSPKTIPSQTVQLTPDWWKILIPAQEAFLSQALASDRPVYLQPVCPDTGPNGAAYQQTIERCLQLCHQHGCHLSLQLHKYLGIP